MRRDKRSRLGSDGTSDMADAKTGVAACIDEIEPVIYPVRM